MIILWRRLDYHGHEWCSLNEESTTFTLNGIALFLYENLPWKIDYSIECDKTWRTRSVLIHGEQTGQLKYIEIKSDTIGHWTLGGNKIPQVDGCIDIDLGFSPSTNLLPIRRLSLKQGEKKNETAAWIEFPSFQIRPLEQTYKRIDEHLYHYESANGEFQRNLLIDEEGFITKYPGFWEQEAA